MLSILIFLLFNIKGMKYSYSNHQSPNFLVANLALRCWICGTSAALYNTDPTDPNRQNFDVSTTSWCSSMVTSANCAPKNPGDEVLCYKEIWTVDGSTSKTFKRGCVALAITIFRIFLVVKRGCAKKDNRYQGMGCEEQLTGSGNFQLTLCLCNESYCNSTTQIQLSLSLIGLYLLRMLPYSCTVTSW